MEEKYYCPNCDWEVQEGDPKCYNCDQELDWDEGETNAIKKIVKEKVEEKEEYFENREEEKKASKKDKEKQINQDIKETYKFFLSIAKIYSILFYIIGIILLILGIVAAVGMENDIGIGLLFTCIILGIICIGIGVLYEKNLKYKAYVLRSLHEINLNIKSRK